MHSGPHGICSAKRQTAWKESPILGQAAYCKGSFQVGAFLGFLFATGRGMNVFEVPEGTTKNHGAGWGT
jgi:hypothetical protein